MGRGIDSSKKLTKDFYVLLNHIYKITVVAAFNVLNQAFCT